MTSQSHNAPEKGVSMDQAAVVHALLSQCFETSLRQQLQSGDFNAAMMGKVLEWLKHNNVNCTEDADASLKHIANAFRRLEGDSLEYIFSDIKPTQI